MKKVALSIIVALIIPCCLFAARGILDFTMGVALATEYTPQDIIEDRLPIYNLEPKKLGLGAVAEVKLTFLSVDARAFYDPEALTVSGNVFANFVLDFLCSRFKFGIGYAYGFDITEQTFSIGNSNSSTNSFENFKDAAFDINLGVDVLIGDLTIGAFATLPTEYVFGSKNIGPIFDVVKNNWTNAKLGAYIGVAFL